MNYSDTNHMYAVYSVFSDEPKCLETRSDTHNMMHTCSVQLRMVFQSKQRRPNYDDVSFEDAKKYLPSTRVQRVQRGQSHTSGKQL